MNAFSYGLEVPGLRWQLGHFATTADIEPLATPPARRAPAIRPLPPVADWANVHDLGVTGDGQADDTVALQRAIDSHRVIYLPLGVYRVTNTIQLRPDSVLIGLQPSLTQIALADNTPGYQGVGEPKPLVRSADGGDAIVSGVGLATGGVNPRATALLWSAGENSLVDDVKFEGGHGTLSCPNGTRFNPYNANHSADADPARRWDGQYPSLWVTHGGGGTFNGIWSPDTYASAGFYISDFNTPGHVYDDFRSSTMSVTRSCSTGQPSGNCFAPQNRGYGKRSLRSISLELRDFVKENLIATIDGAVSRNPATWSGSAWLLSPL